MSRAAGHASRAALAGSQIWPILAISVAMHGAAGGLAWHTLAGRDDTAPATQAASMRIALGSRGAAAGATAAPVTEPVETPQPMQDTARPVEQTRREPVPQPAPRQVRARAAAPVEHPRPDTTPPEPQAAAQPAPSSPPVMAGAGGVAGTSEASPTPQTSSADDAPGFAAAIATHDGLVLAALERAKRYPAMARQRGQEGVVGIMFEIDRDGHVIAADIAVSSGSRRLDRAVIEQVHRAAFPAAPDSVSWRTRRYVTEVRFSLRG